MNTVAILGLGLMGGSLARDLREAGIDVLGYDHARDTLQAAQRAGALSESLGPDLQGLEMADGVVLAVPVNIAPRLLRDAAARLQGAQLITDVGSTKGAICAAAQELGLGERFVGSHPFAGDHRSGWEASRAGLYQGERVFLCPVRNTTPAVLERAHDLWKSVGAHSEVMDAETHDERLAWWSHLPQAAASALALALADAGVDPVDLGRGGRDGTRLAGSDPEMWTGIMLENAEHTTDALAALERRIAALRAQLERRDEAAIRATFAQALRWTHAVASNG